MVEIERRKLDGEACEGCEWAISPYDIRECLLIVNVSDPEFCPGAVDNADASELEDEGLISVVPKLSAYDE